MASLISRIVECWHTDATNGIDAMLGAGTVTWSIGEEPRHRHRDGHHVSWIVESARYELASSVGPQGLAAADTIIPWPAASATRKVRALWDRTLRLTAHVWALGAGDSGRENAERIEHDLALAGRKLFRAVPIATTWRASEAAHAGGNVRGTFVEVSFDVSTFAFEQAFPDLVTPAAPATDPSGGELTEILTIEKSCEIED